MRRLIDEILQFKTALQTLSISFNYQAIIYLIVSRFQQHPGDFKTGHTEMNLVHHYSTISRVHSSSVGGRGKWIKIAHIKTTQHDYHANRTGNHPRKYYI